MNIDFTAPNTYLFGIVGLVVFIFLLRLLVRWLFSVDRQVNTQKAIALLLVEIAKKQGVDEVVVKDIKTRYNINPE